ncbi:MAG: hypothetical protein KGL50_03600, partial [Burkholderiales bacterium]|nr:hypothetical protein [Burkholderiales bacterium]
ATPAAALASAPVSEIDFQGAGGTAALPPVGGLTTGANLSVPTGSPAVYPTTVAITGGISFGVSQPLQAQAITFASPGNQTLGTAPPALNATATSGLPVAIASTTTSVCTVSGSTLTLVAAGTCSLTATQPGNATYAAATPVTVSFSVSGGAVTALTFSSGFAAGNRTNEGGAYFGYGGSNQDGYNCTNPANCGSGSGGSGATSYYYVYYQTPTPATALFDGAGVLAPGVTALSTTGDTPGVQIAGQTTVNFTFNQNPEWYASATHNFGVLLTLGKFYNLGSTASPQPCNIKLLAVVAPLNGGAAAPYSIPLSSFAVIQNCNTGIATPAAALASAPVSEIDFQGAGGTAALPPVNGLTTGANLSVPTGSPAVYPTTVAITGGISFKP